MINPLTLIVPFIGIWAGHFARDHCFLRPGTPELFLYSNNDYYLSYQYLERNVLGKNIIIGVTTD